MMDSRPPKVPVSKLRIPHDLHAHAYAHRGPQSSVSLGFIRSKHLCRLGSPANSEFPKAESSRKHAKRGATKRLRKKSG